MYKQIILLTNLLFFALASVDATSFEPSEILSTKVETLSEPSGILSTKVETLSEPSGILSTKVETLISI